MSEDDHSAYLDSLELQSSSALVGFRAAADGSSLPVDCFASCGGERS